MTLTYKDYYDSGTVYENDIAFSQVIEELNSKEQYSKNDIKKILKGLIDDLVDEHIDR